MEELNVKLFRAQRKAI